MEKITARDKNHLRELINQAIDNKHMYCDLNFIDVSQVTDMSGLFSGSYFKGDISRWDVSNVTNMSGMFHRASFNGDISRWNVSKVKDMSYMFCGYGHQTTEHSFDGDISRWDVSNVTNMTGMFSFSKFNGNISKWNVSNVQFMKAMFAVSNFRGDIDEWDTSKVTNIDYMFKNSAIKALGKIPAWYKESENANLFKNGWGNSSRERDRIYEKDIFVMLQNPAKDK